MTLQEILKAQGLTEEQVTKVLAEMKTNKIFTSSEENLDIRYGKLKGDFDALTKTHGESATLIEQLKKDNAGNEAMQVKIKEYEATIAEQQKELEATKIDNALKLALLEAKATDLDYLSFKIREKGELKLDDDGKIKGIADTLTLLKTQFPNQFATEGAKKIEEQKLPKSDDPQPTVTKAEFLRKPYAERAAFATENPEAYSTLMNS